MTDTKERILDTTAELFRRYGYTGTGLKQIVAEAQAPFGSIYHFFPDGKAQLGREVIHRSGRMYLELFAQIARDAPDAVSAVEDFFRGAAELLRQTDYADACPIATVALEVASTNEPLRQATAEVFESWIAGGTILLEHAGIPTGRARELAILLVAALEGAFVLSRAAKTTDAVEIAGRAIAEAVRAAIPSRRIRKAR
jgi:AcrR family transcriptional regulator